MHESHLVDQMFADLLAHAQKNNVKKIRSVTVRLGELSEIKPEILEHFFNDHTAGTILEGAKLKLEPGAIRELRLVSFEGE